MHNGRDIGLDRERKKKMQISKSFFFEEREGRGKMMYLFIMRGRVARF
jgi:hypothetical protein